jgi:hypothetical protein
LALGLGLVELVALARVLSSGSEIVQVLVGHRRLPTLSRLAHGRDQRPGWIHNIASRFVHTLTRRSRAVWRPEYARHDHAV